MVEIPDLYSPLPNRTQAQEDFDLNMAGFMRTLPATIQGMRTGLNAVLTAVAADNSQALAQAAAYALAASQSAQSALAAWSASMAPAETLPAVASAIHSGVIVRAIIYDTARDSDGGAWRKRCRHTSWYNETLATGLWRGQRANEAACRAVSGAAAGDYYQNTTDGKFYMLVGGAGQTEVFRGNSRDFPALAAVVTEAARVVIYDLTQPTAPMWMVFYRGAASWTTGNMAIVDVSVTSVAALNGELLITSNSTGLARVNFVRDSGQVVTAASAGGAYLGNISQRNAGRGFSNDLAAAGRILAGDARDVAVSVIAGAPTDAATGLPISTIAVATANGVCVLKHDGSVAAVSPAIYSHTAVMIDQRGGLWSLDYSNGTLCYFGLLVTLGASFSALRSFYRATGSIPATIGAYGAPFARAALGDGSVAIGSASGLTLIRPNLAALAASAVAYISDTYASGWLVGDIRGCWLADTLAESVAGGEMVINGNFTSDTSGWTAFNGGTLSVVSGAMRITNDGTGVNRGSAQLALATIPGKSYNISITPVGGSAGNNVYFSLGSTSTVGNLLDGFPATATATFTATSATTYLILSNRLTTAGAYCDVDNVSCKPAVADRSVKNTGMTLNGTLTKAAVAAGAQLCGWSGFSASNYPEQAYSSNLDVGTGDFYVMGWVSPANLASLQYLFARENAGQTAQRVYAWHDATTGLLNFRVTDGTTTTQLSGGAVVAGAPNFVVCLKSGSMLYLYLNGVLVASAAAPSLTLSNATAVFRLGVSGGAITGMQSGWLALWRFACSSLTADQIAQIYREELALMQPGAQCTMAGVNSAVTALAYDDSTGVLHVGASWGRSEFKGLQRINSEATLVGAITALSGAQGAVLQGGASSARYAQAAIVLRDLLNKPRMGRLSAMDRVPSGRSTRTANVQLTAADHGRLIDVTSGTFTQTAADPDSLGADWWVIYRNSGGGIVTLPTADGAVKTLGPNRTCLLSCDGTMLSQISYTRVAGVFHLQERYSSDSFGPGLLNSGTQTRALNTTVLNTLPGASVASNQVTLIAGDYDVSAFATVYTNSSSSSRHRAFLYNVTDGVVALYSPGNVFNASGSYPSSLSGRISISSTKVFELRSYSLAGVSGVLFAGGGVGGAQPEICAELFIKEA